MDGGGTLSGRSPFGQVTETVEAAGRGPYSTNGSVTTDVGSVWAVFGDSTLARVDPRRSACTGSTLAGEAPAGVVVSSGSVWVSNSGSATVQRFNPVTFEEGH